MKRDDTHAHAHQKNITFWLGPFSKNESIARMSNLSIIIIILMMVCLPFLPNKISNLFQYDSLGAPSQSLLHFWGPGT